MDITKLEVTMYGLLEGGSHAEIVDRLTKEFPAVREEDLLKENLDFFAAQVLHRDSKNRYHLIKRLCEVNGQLADPRVGYQYLGEKLVRNFVEELDDLENYSQWADFFLLIWRATRNLT